MTGVHTFDAAMALRGTLSLTGLARRRMSACMLNAKRALSLEEGVEARRLWENQVGFGSRVSSTLLAAKEQIKVCVAVLHAV